MYEAQPRQALFHFSDAEEVFYGGSAGGGKSYAMLWDAIGKAKEYKNVRIGIFRRSYPELEKSIIFRFLADVPSNWYKYNKQSHTVTFLSSGSVIDFNHCQYEHDVFKFQSAEYDFLYFDELTHFTEFQYKYLLTRLRTTKKHIKPQIKSASNPGNIGHLWVKNRFIKVEKEDGTFEDAPIDIPMVRTDLENGQQFTTMFIPAKVEDNKYIMENDPTYISRLERQDADTVKALRDGDWDVFQGQFFKEWRKPIHVVNPYEIPKGWKKFRCLDWGFTNPACCLWIAIKPDKSVVVYRELYVTQTTTSDLSDEITNLTGEEEISYTVADPSMWSTTQYEKGESIAYQMIISGIALVKADNNRISGANRVRDYLKINYDLKVPKANIEIFSSCFNLVRTLPALIHDERNPEDLDTNGEDHSYDALRYGLMSHVSPHSKIETTREVEGSFNKLMGLKQRAREKALYIGGR